MPVPDNREIKIKSAKSGGPGGRGEMLTEKENKTGLVGKSGHMSASWGELGVPVPQVMQGKSSCGYRVSGGTHLNTEG